MAREGVDAQSSRQHVSRHAVGESPSSSDGAILGPVSITFSQTSLPTNCRSEDESPAAAAEKDIKPNGG